jgi:CRISPR-associated protein Cas1
VIGGIVEVAEAGRHLSVHRGFLKVTEDRAELGRVPLDDITALILSGPQITLTKHLMEELAERKAVIVTCGRNWHPVSFTLPFAAHFQAAGILRDQIAASEPLKKRLWQQLVRRKIEHQAAVLARHAPDHPKLSDLTVLARRVKSGDPENMEAQAARLYWPALMGGEFRRDRHGGDSNIYLNYGYTVLRAATARAVCGGGLHPALGLHHGHDGNPFALVDDLMEPFRPLVDAIAHELAADGEEANLDPERKRRIAAVLQQDLMGEKGATPLINCLARLAQSLAASLSEKKVALVLGEMKTSGRLV